MSEHENCGCSEHGVHPAPPIPAAITLPASVVVCPCGLHHMVRGQNVRRSYCQRLKAARS